MFKVNFLSALALLAASVPSFAQSGSVTAQSDSWAITDGLGRAARDYSAAGEHNEKRFVGMFYWTWHQGYDFDGGKDDTTIEVKNITEVLREHPEAINDYNHEAWGPLGHRPGVYYWDQPIFGYYKTTDPWVLRKHAEMLADAGIDCIFMDCTNGSFIWEYSFMALLDTWDQARKDGVNVPKIVFLLPFAATADSKKSLINLYNKIYSKDLYKDLWFYWKGKPLIMAHPDNLATTGVEGTIRSFFTFRGGQPDYVNGASVADKKWGWLEVMPTHGYAFDYETYTYEQCTVGVAQNARKESGGHCCAFNLPGTYGRSYSYKNGFDTRPDAYLYGWNFQEQWDRANDVLKPQMIFVTGWNEWTSGMWTKAHGWSDPLSFVDQFDWDHSRDIEPTAGWGDKGDVYYVQLVDNVRRYKGMDKPQVCSPGRTINLGRQGEWNGLLPYYKAYKGNTFHRDHRGRYNQYYTNNTGRNDIVGAQVSHDGSNVYFRVETADKLTPSTDPQWMMLFIDADRDKSTGWYGYDFIVNRVSPTSDEVCVERCDGTDWNWSKVGTGYYVISSNGKALEIAIPKSTLGMSAEVDFEFKWKDNMQKLGDIMDFYVNGDTAPGGRFNYVYTSKSDSSVEEIAADAAKLNASAVEGGIYVVCSEGFKIHNLEGVLVASGEAGNHTLRLGAGLYIVSSGGESVKIPVAL